MKNVTAASLNSHKFETIDFSYQSTLAILASGTQNGDKIESNKIHLRAEFRFIAKMAKMATILNDLNNHYKFEISG